MRFIIKKSKEEVIGSQGSFKHKKDETIEEFYKRVMVETKINSQHSNQFKKVRILNGLEKNAKHIYLMPTNDLDKAKTSAQKSKFGQIRIRRYLGGSDNDESNDD